MNGPRASDEIGQGFDQLPPEAMLRVNNWCDQYEQVLRERADASLEEFWPNVHIDAPEEIRVLVRELIVIDTHHRIAMGQSPRGDDYRWLGQQLPVADDQVTRWIQRVSATYSTDAKPNDTGVLSSDQRIGDYLVLREIGRGGMGHVYRACHLLMDRHVAIKTLAHRISLDPMAQARFAREVRSVARLDHPNIVTAFDARWDDDIMYLVTEWIDGSDLSRLVAKEGPLPAEKVVHIAKQAARGLRFAHENGVVHRDIKPGNLVLDPKEVIKILDLGLAKPLFEIDDAEVSADAITKSNQIVGTPAFVSPEQARNPFDANEQSDIYSLGCTMFFLLTGGPPYKADNQVDMIIAHSTSPTPLARDVLSTVPECLSDLVARMMDKQPERRPTSMDRVLDELVEMRGLDRVTGLPSDTVRSGLPMESTLGQPIGSVIDGVLKQDESPHRQIHWYRGFLLGTALATCVAALAWVRSFDSPTEPSPNVSSSPKLALPERPEGLLGGLSFNGRSYVEVADFDLSISDSMMLEVAVTPHRGPSPSVIVSWGGNEAFHLFVATSGKWGAGVLRDGVSQLRVLREPIDYDRLCILSARYEDNELSLFLDGHPVESENLDYQLLSGDAMLCMGGLPPGYLPPERGERFFTGEVHAVRVSQGDLPLPGVSAESLLEHDQSTVAVFDFGRVHGDRVVDLTDRRWQAKLVNFQ